MYQKISFEDELPPENVQVAIFDKRGEMYAGRYSKGYILIPNFSEFHPVSWYTFWLKEVNPTHLITPTHKHMEKITREEYMILVEGCKPYSSFSDPDGILPFGYGRPAMDTVWGKDDKDIVRCEMRKENRHQIEWEYTYYKL